VAVSKKRIWGWMSFDWATQPFYTSGLTFIFGPYFAVVAVQYFTDQGLDPSAAKAQSQSLWSSGQMIAGLIIAFTAPFLGAYADNSGRKMPWIAFFSVIYIVASALLWNLKPDGTGLMAALVIFFIAFIAAESALNFVNAILPSLGTKEEIGRISGSGAAFGYWGGFVSLLIMLLLFVENTETGLTLLGNPPPFGLDASELEGNRSIGPFIAIWFMVFLRSVVKRRSLFNFLIGSMFYRDALNALYAFGGVYAALVLDWETQQIGVFGIIAVISAAVFTWVAGLCDQRWGPKPVIRVTVWILIFVSVTIITLFTYMTGNNQLGFVPVIFLFLIGLILLRWVNKDGDRAEWVASQ